jgi:type II secretory pathway component PulF
MQLDLARRFARLQFGAAERLRVYRKIAKMLSNGMPLLKLLEELHQRASDDGRKADDSMAIVLGEWRRTVQNGRMLSEAMAWWVPKSEQMIIMAGEQAGQLEAGLVSVVKVVEAGAGIRRAILGGLAYPVALLALVLSYIYLFGVQVIPQFSRIVDPTAWRGAAKSLHLMSTFVQQWMLPLVVVLVLAIVAVVASMPRWRGNLRVFLDRVPPYSIYRLMVGSSFLMSFAALQSAGMTVERSLVRLSDLSGPWLRERMDGALLGIKSGLNCGEALRQTGYAFPSKEIVDDLCVYAEFRGFGDALQLLADEWMAEGVATVTRQMKVLNGFSIALLAVVIAWLVTGFFGIQQEIASITRAMR